MTNTDENWSSEMAPVMEELGIALHASQTFEYTLCLLMSLLAEHQGPSGGETFSKSWDFHSKKTLGNLVSALKKEVDVPEDYLGYLKGGVECRNRIVHRFISEAGMRLLDPQGRLEVILELKDLRETVRSRDKSLEPLVDKLLEKYGQSTESLKEQADSHWKWVNYETSERQPRKDQ